jgi:hypothetical protein
MADDGDRERDEAPEGRRRAETLPPVREEDLEPHEGLRYVAKLFKTLALLLIFMLIAEMVIGFNQDGMAALGTLLVEATRLIVFAGLLWGVGDMALMFISANHDLRATMILLGRLSGRLERFLTEQAPPGPAAGLPPAAPPPPPGPPVP